MDQKIREATELGELWITELRATLERKRYRVQQSRDALKRTDTAFYAAHTRVLRAIDAALEAVKTADAGN